ncbi:MAG: DUF5711 family protein [Eubacteriales bacterium]|nr:DUF5711 family protein [Eubacteriales bacterium]
MYKKAKKYKLSRKSILFLISIFVVLIVLVIGIVMLLTRGKEVKDALITMPFTTGDSYFSVGNTVVYSDDDLLTCIDTSLNEKWQLPDYTGEPDFTSNDDITAAASNDVLKVINAKGEYLFSYQLDSTILSTRVCTNKVAVSVEQAVNDDTHSYIIIFDLTGTSLYKIDISDKYVLDYGFDSQSDQLYVLELDVSGAAPVSKIFTYRPETQSITGIIELKDQLVGSVYIIDGVIYTIGTNRLTMHTSLNTSREVLIYGWVLNYIYDSDNPIFVFVPSADDMSHIDIAHIINTSGDETTINLPPNVFSIVHTGGKIYCFATDNIFVYTDEGIYSRTYTLPFTIDGIKGAMDGYVFMTQGENVYLLPLP